MQKLILGLVLVSSLTGCSYFKRKSCESNNWFEHGRQIAMRGLRLTGDAKVEECRKVDADISDSQLDLGWKTGQGEYCSLAGAYQTGRKGLVFNGEICNASDFAKLDSENKKGIRDYCTPENGEELGRKGETYEKVCPENLLKRFVLAFNKGRKSYLTKKTEQLKNDLHKNESDLRYQEGRLEAYNAQLRYAEGRLYGLSVNATPQERSSAQSQYDSAQGDVHRAQSAVRSLQDSIHNVQSELNNAERELAGL
ncbi:MAG: DUF2799 domain-containing protein [Bdellovibrio sp.]